ncbi:peptidase U35, partial [Rhodobacteraceae bacterium WD3A24]
WSTGSERVVPRFFDEAFIEQLSMDDGAVRLDRLNNGAPVLDSHNRFDLGSVIGVVVEGSARIENGRGVATIRFSEREDVEPIWRDVMGGIIRNISVGYRVHRFEIEKREGELDVWRAVDWEPMEVSAVAVAADPGAHVRSDADGRAPNECVLARQDGATEAADAAQPTEAGMPKDNKATAAGAAAEHIEAGQVENRAAQSQANEAGNQAPGETRAHNGDPAQGTQTGTAPASEPSAEQVRAEERKRVSDIYGLASRHDLPQSFAADLVERGVTLDAARAAILEKLAEEGDVAGRSSEPSVPAQARGDGSREVAYRDAMTNALMHRHDPAHVELRDDAREFMGLSMIEMARHALSRRMVDTRGMNKMDTAAEALGMRAVGYHSTSDFAAILANVANKTLRSAYERTPRTFTAWARQTSLTDFKPVNRTQLSGAPDLKKVAEDAEFTYGTMKDGKEVYQLATYGRIIAVTRQTLIDDDLDAFTRVPAAFGAAAADLESDIVYAILSANPNMGDGVALFHADHSNLAGSGTKVTEAALAAAYRAFGQQKGLEERLISILPQYIIVPPGSRSVEARKQLTATTPSSAGDVNPFAGRMQVVEEPRLIPSSGNDPWYLAADPNRIDTIEFAYLDGQQGVYTETRTGFEKDGVEIKARHDFTAKAIDHRGLYKNP